MNDSAVPRTNHWQGLGLKRTTREPPGLVRPLSPVHCMRPPSEYSLAPCSGRPRTSPDHPVRACKSVSMRLLRLLVHYCVYAVWSAEHAEVTAVVAGAAPMSRTFPEDLARRRELDKIPSSPALLKMAKWLAPDGRGAGEDVRVRGGGERRTVPPSGGDATGALFPEEASPSNHRRKRRESGPSSQDIRDSVIPHLRQYETVLDRSTFLILWYLLSHNMHGTWEDANSLYGGPALAGGTRPSADSHRATGSTSPAHASADGAHHQQQPTAEESPCTESTCLNGGVCYVISGAVKCRCTAEYWGRRCHKRQGHERSSGSGARTRTSGQYRDYVSWSSMWETKRK